MTLCLALKALDWDFGSSPLPEAIVLCSDSLGSNDFSSTENVSKFETLPQGFGAMLAGQVATARELLQVVREKIEDGPIHRITDLLDRLRQSVRQQKQRFAEEHIGARLGISYREFRQNGRSAFSDDLFRETSWEIRNHRLEAELLIAGFIKGRATIVKLSAEQVTVCDSYGAIGSGALLAEASLMQRDYLPMGGVDYAAYIAFEAKRMSERAPGVGRQTGLMALRSRPSGDTILDIYPPDFMSILDADFKRFAPRPLAARKLTPIRGHWFRVIGSDHELTTDDSIPQPPSQE